MSEEKPIYYCKHIKDKTHKNCYTLVGGTLVICDACNSKLLKSVGKNTRKTSKKTKNKK